MKMTKTMWWTIGGAGIAGLGVGAYFFMKHRKKVKGTSFATISNPGKPVQVIRGGSATPVVEPNWKNPFDMNYIKDVKKWLGSKRIKELSPGAASTYALQLKKAKGRFNDDEQAVEHVFKRLRDKTQVASLSKAFYFNHKKDMWQYLRGFLSDSEMKKLVHDPVRQLPNYRLLT